MNLIDDLPFYLVAIFVFINMLIGISTGTELTTLMLRSIVITIVSTILGLVLSSALKSARVEIEKAAENKAKNSSGNTIDIKLPPDEDEILINYKDNSYEGSYDNVRSYGEDEFQEVNPAYLQRSDEE